jgi:hypothetical protein
VVWFGSTEMTQCQKEILTSKLNIRGLAYKMGDSPARSAVEWEELDSTRFENEQHAFTLFLKTRLNSGADRIGFGFFFHLLVQVDKPTLLSRSRFLRLPENSSREIGILSSKKFAYYVGLLRKIEPRVLLRESFPSRLMTSLHKLMLASLISRGEWRKVVAKENWRILVPAIESNDADFRTILKLAFTKSFHF